MLDIADLIQEFIENHSANMDDVELLWLQKFQKFHDVNGYLTDKQTDVLEAIVRGIKAKARNEKGIIDILQEGL